jgi:hypothetical protein
MRQRLSCLLGLAVAFAMAVSAHAQQQLSGQIVATDEAQGTFTVQTDAGERIMLRATDETEFRSQGQASELGNLQIGDRVSVQMRAAPGESEGLALSVDIEPTTFEAAPAEIEAEPDPEPSALPDTGGPLPLLALLGGAALGGGMALRSLRRRG